MSVPVTSVRHEVRGELDAFEVEAERLCQGAHHERLRGPRQPRDQAVTADQNRDQQFLDDGVLAHDDAAQPSADRGHGVAEPRDQSVGVDFRDRVDRFRHFG